jgi:pyridoxine 5-phosphate synthase
VSNPILLGVNVDHVATIRQARGSRYPDPVHAALQAEMAGADGITMHLREDRRHVQDEDIERFAACTQTKLNFEMAATDEMRDIALRVKPVDVCIVPEKREELTTDQAQIEASRKAGAAFIEIHTGSYAEAQSLEQRERELAKIVQAAEFAESIGLKVNAGHGLTRHNVAPIAAIPQMHELNIGHALIADALFTGLPQAIRDMKQLMLDARRQ